MAKRPMATGSETTPTDFPQTTPPPSGYEPSHVIQSLIELQKSVAALGTKQDRLIADVEKIDGHMDRVRQKIGRAEGILICGFVLVGLFAGFVWWLVGGQISALRDQMMVIRPAIEQQSDQGD